MQAFSLIYLFIAFVPAMACGPFYPIIPTPRFFGLPSPCRTIADYDREENIRLWQQLTSPDIPLSDIEQAVYSDSKKDFLARCDSATNNKCSNLFYRFISSKGKADIKNFLSTAKDLEERWNELRSPWYYPSDRENKNGVRDLEDIIERCRTYKGGRLHDRYALQAVRALFASRRWADCIEFSDSAFADVPDSNLLKRMARRYEAGCWNRLGNKHRADSIFASAGDLWSVSAKDPVAYFASHNPDAPLLMDYIRTKATDSTFMARILPLADDLLQNKRVRYKGDWEFLMAYGAYSQEGNVKKARKHIRKSLRNSFSSDELHDLANAFRIKLDALSGDARSLLADLKWLEIKAAQDSFPNGEWSRMSQNIIYEDWVPSLWGKKDFAKAILLCAYADKLPQTNGEYESNDYSNLSFQMMGSLSSRQLANAYRKICLSSPLNDFLRSKARTDRDYYYELIGTLALREERYDDAVSYLSKVSEAYLNDMNICKEGYLARDPFSIYPSRWHAYNEDDDPLWHYENQAGRHNKIPKADAKLKFAKRMLALRQEMTKAKSADKRGLARLRYAIGRFNSFEECWALTQYWRGNVINRFSPILQYWDDYNSLSGYDFLYDYNRSVGHRQTEEVYDREVSKALHQLVSDEAHAEAEYIMGNLKTVVRKYPDTSTAETVRTSCDNWKNWL